MNAAASTLVALTFEAATRSADMQATAAVPPADPAPTFSPARLYINTEVKCRSGIGADFKVLATFPAGTLVDMVGRASAEGAWLIQLPGTTQTCWVRALDSSPSGGYEVLPEVTPQPGSGHPPAAPVNLSWPFYCTYVDGVLYEINAKLSWVPTAVDANGFRVYRQGTQIADLPPDVTTFTDVSKVEVGTNLTYSVEAYNEAGASPRLSKTLASVCK